MSNLLTNNTTSLNVGSVQCSGVQVSGNTKGVATLVGGTKAVALASIQASNVVLLSRQAIGGTAGNLTYAINPGIEFTISSSDAGDTSTVSYLVV